MRQFTAVTVVLILLLGAGWAGASIITADAGDPVTIAEPIALSSDLTVSAATGSHVTVSGPISGAGRSVTLTGGGELTLSGNNAYTGGTAVGNGTLDFASPDAVPTTGIISVSRPGSVDLTSRLSGLVARESAVPEPAALLIWSLLGLGCAGFLVARR